MHSHTVQLGAAGMQAAHGSLVSLYLKHAKSFPGLDVLSPACCHIADPANGINIAGEHHIHTTHYSRSGMNVIFPLSCKAF